MRTPFHIRWGPDNRDRKTAALSPELAKFQNLLRELFQFDCADLDFGIYRIMNHKRAVVDRYIEEELPTAIERAVGQGAIQSESERAEKLKETRQQVVDFLGEDAIAPGGELLKHHDLPLGKKYLLWRRRARYSESAADVRRDIYNHLFAFFSRYFHDGDFFPKRRYSWEHPYVVPYDGEEVYFHWANRDQYYIKAEEHFTDYTFQTPSGVSVRYFVRSADTEQNDRKGKRRYYLPVLEAATWSEDSRALAIPFDFRPITSAEARDLPRSGRQDSIILQGEAAAGTAFASAPAVAEVLLSRRESGIGDEEMPTLFTYHARRFARRRSSDFFIHRDLEGFLDRELEHYLRSEVLSLSALAAGGEERADAWLDKMRVIREVGRNIIAILAQIEGFQKMLWEKRKFVVKAGYCVAARLIPAELRSQVVACEPQWEEWRSLGCINSDNTLFAIGNDFAARHDFLDRHPSVLVDSKHFGAGFMDDLAASIDNLDDKTDGVAIWSENWQALNLLEERYRGALSGVYIDPPYNTAASAILYKNDYKDSSWLSLMADRLALTRRLLTPEGTVSCAIDDEEVSRLRMVMQELFPKEIGTVVVRSNPAGRKSTGQLSPSHEFALFFGNQRAEPGSLKKTKSELARYRFEDELGRYDWNNLIRHGSGDLRSDSPKLFFPIYVSKDGQIRVPRLMWIEHLECYEVLDEPRGDEDVVLPTRGVGSQTIEKRWHRGWETITANPGEYRVRRTGATISIDFKIRMDVTAAPKTWWGDSRYASSNRGARTAKDLFGAKPFDYPKAVGLVEDCIRVCANGDAPTVLDFFAGSGTTGHAVINLNREDGKRRKFILVEMGDHFETVILPRLKKVAFCPEWKGGIAKREATNEEARRGPRIIKYFGMESYEDALNNIEFEQPDEGMFKVDDYMLRYMLRWETKASATFLNVGALERPFDYTLHIGSGRNGAQLPVDVPETFNYLLGLTVATRRAYEDEGRRYLVYTGNTRDGRKAVVIWRNTEGWTLEDRMRDRDFVTANGLTTGAEQVWVNGDSMVEGARPLDTVFKQRMFSSAGS